MMAIPLSWSQGNLRFPVPRLQHGQAQGAIKGISVHSWDPLRGRAGGAGDEGDKRKVLRTYDKQVKDFGKQRQWKQALSIFESLKK